MRPTHLTTELDAMFLSVLKRALMEAGDTIPEWYVEVAAGLVTGGHDMKYVYDEYCSLRGPDTCVWTRLDSAISYMSPNPDEVVVGFKSPSRPEWDRTAFRALTEAVHLLDKRCHETSTPP